MRKKFWESEMYKAIQRYQSISFEWGKHDCMLFVADVVLSYTGEDYAREYRGAYSDKKGAKKIVMDNGGSLEGAMNLKFHQTPIAFARRGDVVMYKKALGICTGKESFFYDVDGYIKAMPTAQVERAWRIP